MTLLAMSCVAQAAHAATFDLATATTADIQAAMDSGALTSEKLVQLYLKRIEAYDKQGPKINAVITLNPKALEEARALDKERKAKGPRSQLHGVPVVFKDLVDVKGLPTTAGHAPFGAPVPSRDAFIVSRLRASGAVMLAKVSTRNWFGSDDQHPIGHTLNPYKPGYSPGFTSNGSGAAIAAIFSSLAIGTDNSASVQHPSANCSIVGMVATQGMVSRAGVIPNGATQDRPGPMARSVYDVAAMMSVISGWDAEDLFTLNAMGHFPQSDWSKQLDATSIKGKRIGVLREMIYEGPQHAEGRALFERALADMRKAGAFIVDPVLTGIDLKTQTLGAYTGTSGFEELAFQNAYLARLGTSKWKSIEEMLEKTVEPVKPQLSADKNPDYLARLRTRAMYIKLIHDTMDKFSLDAIALPYRTLPPEPYPGPRPAESTTNLTSSMGLPAVIVPGGYTKDNLPIGIQILGRQYSEQVLLQVAYGFEQASKRRKTPELTPALPGERFDY